MRKIINAKLKEVNIRPFFEAQLMNLMYFIKYYARSVLIIYAIIFGLIWMNVNKFVVIRGVSPKEFIDFLITFNIILCGFVMIINFVSILFSIGLSSAVNKCILSREEITKLIKTVISYFLFSTILSAKEEMITTTIDFNDISMNVYSTAVLYGISYIFSRLNIKLFWKRVTKNVEIKSKDFLIKSEFLDSKYLEEQVVFYNNIDQVVKPVAIKKEVTKINDGIVESSSLYEVQSVTLALKYSIVPYVNVNHITKQVPVSH
ncbi:hypothetical protein IGJ21_002589 [Enterococcus sp. DIV2416]|uniref:hypothetical protein n=1 Tax=Enterococcus TaxID=1350 RepID=UPI0030C8661D